MAKPDAREGDVRGSDVFNVGPLGSELRFRSPVSGTVLSGRVGFQADRLQRLHFKLLLRNCVAVNRGDSRHTSWLVPTHYLARWRIENLPYVAPAIWIALFSGDCRRDECGWQSPAQPMQRGRRTSPPRQFRTALRS